jgi:hypothetical protein
MALTKIKGSGIAADAITANNISTGAVADLLIAGRFTTIEANGRISSAITAGDKILVEANGRISSTITAGDKILVEANGRISSTATELDFNPLSLMLSGM